MVSSNQKYCLKSFPQINGTRFRTRCAHLTCENLNLLFSMITVASLTEWVFLKISRCPSCVKCFLSNFQTSSRSSYKNLVKLRSYVMIGNLAAFTNETSRETQLPLLLYGLIVVMLYSRVQAQQDGLSSQWLLLIMSLKLDSLIKSSLMSNSLYKTVKVRTASA